MVRSDPIKMFTENHIYPFNIQKVVPVPILLHGSFVLNSYTSRVHEWDVNVPRFSNTEEFTARNS